ncbi:MAG: nicotinate (nicotinamide) nucleotide adenylyltransferase [Myxococcales bacterium]|nr:nicotinate (nicotinamide) nucleotide adenylyltransferase [Myxococcales bacterium]
MLPSPTMRVALFGGSFNPPHVGHQMAMVYALATARVDRLLMVPCFVHPFDKRLAPFEHRLAMARLAAEPFNGRVEVSDVEERLGGESRTLHTVQALYAMGVAQRIVVVIGADLLAERERWYRYQELERLVDFFTVGRVGHTGSGEVSIPDISSTEIRRRAAAGEAIGQLVPATVADHIATHGLYRR